MTSIISIYIIVNISVHNKTYILVFISLLIYQSTQEYILLVHCMTSIIGDYITVNTSVNNNYDLYWYLFHC